MPRRPTLDRFATLLLPLLLLPTTLRAQAGSAVPALDSRIRVRPACASQAVDAAGGSRACAPVVGRLLAWQGDSLVVLGADGRRVFHADSAMRVDVSAGRRGNTWAGLGLGTLAGFVTGMLASSHCESSGGPKFVSCDLAYLFTVPLGTGLGALMGASIRTERWRPVTMPAAAAVRIVPSAERLSVAVTVPF